MNNQSQQIGMPHVAASNMMSMQNISVAQLNDKPSQDYVPFKEKYSITKRQQWHNEACVKFPTKVAIIVERAANSDPSITQLANPKFLMPKAFSIGEVISVVRSKLNLSKEKGLVLYESKGKYMLKPSHNIGEVYEQYRDEDGFLYLVYSQENTYG